MLAWIPPSVVISAISRRYKKTLCSKVPEYVPYNLLTIPG
jgi:hypothetical protein